MARLRLLLLLALGTTASAQVSSDDALASARAFINTSLPASCEAGLLLPDGTSELLLPLSSTEPAAGWLALFPCRLGIYNVVTTSVHVDAAGRASELLLPGPQLEVIYVAGNSSGPVESITITGTVLSSEAVNASYDPDNRTLDALDKWRGLGDAFTDTQWRLEGDAFRLVYVAVDATYDTTINPIVLLDER